MFEYKITQNQSFISNCKNLVASPVLAEINGKTDDLLKFINETEAKMAVGKSGVGEFLSDGSGSRTGLTTALKEYSDYLSGLTPGSDFGKYAKLLDPSVYLPEFNPEKDRVSMMTGQHMLELMKNGVLTAESYALSVVSNQ